MSRIPIFDSLTHPMPHGTWLTSSDDGRTSAATLKTEMDESGVRAALAVGMGSAIGGYREESYPAFVNEELPGAHPIAFFDIHQGEAETSLRSRLETIAALGYLGIKIHPRLACIDYSHPLLPVAIRIAHELSLPVLLCTYSYERGRSPAGNSLDDLVELIHECGEARVLLLHGGVFHALELSEIIRPYPNLLLDLSFTLCRFPGSSLDLDIRYLFQQFDRRLCVGSDHPQFSLTLLRERFESFADDLHPEKAENIAHKNLIRFLELESW